MPGRRGVLRGRLKPHQCPAFGSRCTPEHPLGAPMVSSEGACAAYYNYGRFRAGSRTGGALIMAGSILAGGALSLSACRSSPVADRVQLGHGSGGKISAALLRDAFPSPFQQPGAGGHWQMQPWWPLGNAEIAISTDTFVVRPLEFPGGNIGSLAVHGTLNDIAMMGCPSASVSSAGFVLEEGLSAGGAAIALFASMAAAALAGGGTAWSPETPKWWSAGKADGMFINTTGTRH